MVKESFLSSFGNCACAWLTVTVDSLDIYVYRMASSARGQRLKLDELKDSSASFNCFSSRLRRPFMKQPADDLILHRAGFLVLMAINQHSITKSARAHHGCFHVLRLRTVGQ